MFFVLLRLPSLGHDLFNTDVWKWKARTYDFGTGVFTLDFEKTIQKYHPGVTLMWTGVAGVKIFNLYNKVPEANVAFIFGLHSVQKILVVLIIGITMSSIFYVLKKLFGKKYALLTTFLICVEPFYVALTRVFHLEGLMTTFMIASLVWFYLSLQRGKGFIQSAIFASLSVLTKTSALILLPFFGIIFFLRKEFRKGAIWFCIFILGFVFLWPAMYTHSLLALETLYRGIFTIGIERSHIQLFLGKWVEDPGITFYPIVFLLRSSIYLLVGLVGYPFLKNKDKQKTGFIKYMFSFGLLYFISMNIPAKKLDRYLLPTMISWLFVVAAFFEGYLDKLKTAVFVGIAIFILIYLHPNYLSYYTVGLRNGIHMIEPKWMFGQREIQDYFKASDFERFKDGETFDQYINNDELENKLTIGFKEKYYTQVWPFINEIGGRATIKDITAQAKQTNVFVYPVWDDDSFSEDRFKIKFIGNIKLRGVPIYNVYQRD
ncbi:glycosyltransferase family 39 protein [Patescibacteria group bacterium]|nr:glycosyltransferase family 39 protein [Patescibacteria group bacterium]